jgi:hypothetical protein
MWGEESGVLSWCQPLHEWERMSIQRQVSFGVTEGYRQLPFQRMTVGALQFVLTFPQKSLQALPPPPLISM